MFDFSGLINAILRKKPGDPVGDLKSATIWVQELPLADVHRAHVEIVRALSSINENKKMPLKERIRVCMYLNEKAQGLQNNLCRDYLAVTDDEHAVERSYLQTILAFWDEMAVAYQICIRNFAQDPSAKLWPTIHIITARALHYYAMQAKWAHLRYLPVEGALWRNLHRLYLFSEREEFDKTALKLFPDSLDTTNCLSEYLQPMMLHLANPESLLPLQIHQLDQWLDTWAKSLTLENQFRPHRQLYAVNLGDTKPARSLRRNMLGEKYRYWGVGLLVVTIEKTIDQLKSGELPARLGLGEDCRLPQCLDLIEAVERRWSKKDVQRKHERTPNVKVVHVVQGLHDIIVQLKPGAKIKRKPKGEMIGYRVMGHTVGGTPVDMNTQGNEELFEPVLEQWIMENESVTGYGVTLNPTGNSGLHIGMLTGLKPEKAPHFLIGVVRRMNKNPTSKTYVGIETLCQKPIPVELHALPNGDKPVKKHVEAIYLLEMPEAKIAHSLLLPSKRINMSHLLQLKAQGKTYTIRPQKILEETDDYSRITFDVLARHHELTAPLLASYSSNRPMTLHYQIPLEVITREPVRCSVIWLHGLGANGYDFVPIVEQLAMTRLPATRFIFPHAPDQAVTLNGGHVMPSWYDIMGLHNAAPEDAAGLRASMHYVDSLIAGEIERGIAPQHIVLAGFSQGGNVALNCALRYPQRLAGALILSSYLGLRDQLSAQASAANRNLPIFMAHGTQDDIVPLDFAQAGRDTLNDLGYAVVWQTYPMAHSVCNEEIDAISRWLKNVLPA